MVKKYSNILIFVLIIFLLTSCQTTTDIKDENNNSINVFQESTEESESTKEEKASIIDSLGTTIGTRFHVPEGYERTDFEGENGAFADFMRNYSLKESGSPVLLYNGKSKINQNAHVAVLELPIENEDLQQCADSVMRMYAEYLWASGQYDKISFHFSDGFEVSYLKWREGYRISFENDKPYWFKKTGYDDSYEAFQKYMRIIFAYAGTASMEALESDYTSMEELKVGDVFLKGGSPGHVVMVVDVCENPQGQKAFLLAQGYMPAQEFHVLKNPLHGVDPWYYEEELTYPLRTPEYTFQEGSLKKLNYLHR